MAGKSFDASDPKQVADQEKLAKLVESQRKAVTAQLLASKEGRDWLFQVLKDARVFEERIALSGSQYEQGFFNGQREIGFGLLRLLCRSAPQNFALMISEGEV